jgi:5-(carboxyamino)imidazole ribonucleotide synthase
MSEKSKIKIGVLGGGQLGMMLYEASKEMPETANIELHFLEKNDQFPATKICEHFTSGNFKNYEDVLAFGKDKDVLTIEIEAVNTQALKELEQQGVTVIPQPSVIELIQDKGLQKEFYILNEIPTSPFFFADDKESIVQAIEDGSIELPFVQKARKDGYDGQGVVIIKTKNDLDNLFDVPSIIEEKVDIDKEIAVIVTQDQQKNIACFPSVEMSFHPTANLVEFLFSPSSLSAELENKVQSIAKEIISNLGMTGILAVEFFISKDGEVLVNEVAPRPHNSGHQSIEGNHCSQYEALLHILSDSALPSLAIKKPAVMINLLGELDYTGKAKYQGLEKFENQEGTFVHLYNKEETRPNRKMGHVTVVNDDLDKAIERANFIKEHLKVIA